MHKQTIEEFVYGLPNNQDITIEYYYDYTKVYFYKIKQIKNKQKILALKVIDYDYDIHNGEKSIRILVEE